MLLTYTVKEKIGKKKTHTSTKKMTQFEETRILSKIGNYFVNEGKDSEHLFIMTIRTEKTIARGSEKAT